MPNGTPGIGRERSRGREETRERGRHRAEAARVDARRRPGAQHRHRTRPGSRSSALAASAASIALVGSALFAMPTNSAIAAEASPVVLVATAEQHLQALTVGAVAATPSDSRRDRDDPVAGAIAGVITAQGGAAGQQAASAITAALSASGPRQRIVATALTYLGDPYVLDGTSHSGIDCSGLVLVAYASAGIQLGHLVHLQDDAGVRIRDTDAQPGDLVVFDDEEHIGIYLGGGVLIQAPEEGRPVEITTVWAGVPHHFTRVLP